MNTIKYNTRRQVVFMFFYTLLERKMNRERELENLSIMRENGLITEDAYQAQPRRTWTRQETSICRPCSTRAPEKSA